MHRRISCRAASLREIRPADAIACAARTSVYGSLESPEPKGLGTEAFAALRPAAGQQSATTLRGHARAKTVGTGSMQITGIESTFHSAPLKQKPLAKSMNWEIYERRQGY